MCKCVCIYVCVSVCVGVCVCERESDGVGVLVFVGVYLSIWFRVIVVPVFFCGMCVWPGRCESLFLPSE